jgi:hypothetical protein
MPGECPVKFNTLIFPSEISCSLGFPQHLLHNVLMPLMLLILISDNINIFSERKHSSKQYLSVTKLQTTSAATWITVFTVCLRVGEVATREHAC